MNGSKKRSGKKLKFPGTKWKWKHNTAKPLRHIKGINFLWGKFIVPHFCIKKVRKSTNKELNDATQKSWGKKRTNQTETNKWQEIIKI